MPQDLIERLRYYQGRYLSAADFETQQDYHRSMRRRHNLAQHTWGVVAGLELVEDKDDAGQTAVYALPGFAVDGFGNEIVVLEPRVLPSELFEPFRNQGEQYLSVWIRFLDELSGRPQPGYELCPSDPQYGRIRESFAFVIEPASPEHDSILVAGRTLPLDLLVVDDVLAELKAPIDESVPYQELPNRDDDSARWLVRLGNVRWGGQFLLEDDAKPKRLNQDRLYASLVGEQVMAPQGSLTLRDRRAPQPLPADQADAFYAGATVEVAGSLTIDRKTTAKEDLFVAGKAGLGVEPADVPLRIEGGTAASTAAASGFLLVGPANNTNLVFDTTRILARNNGAVSTLGLQPTGGEVVIHESDAASLVVVSDEGNVGVGVATPKVKLHVAGGADAKPADDASGFAVFGDTAGLNIAVDDNEIMARNSGAVSALHLQADGGDVVVNNNVVNARVVVKGSGRLGVLTNAPATWLHINDNNDASLTSHGLAVFGDAGGLNLVLDDNEIMARNGAAASALHLQALGGDLQFHTQAATDGERIVFRASGQAGFGTSNPRGRFQIAGSNDVTLADDSGLLVLGDVDALNMAIDDNEIQARSNGAASTLFVQREGGEFRIHDALPDSQQLKVLSTGSVGIGTTAPIDKLHVVGDVRAIGYNFISEGDLKRDIKAVEGALGRLAKLRAVSFRWKPEAANDESLQLGLLADEVEAAAPELVSGAPGQRAIRMTSVLALLLQSVKELEQRVQSLEARAGRPAEAPPSRKAARRSTPRQG